MKPVFATAMTELGLCGFGYIDDTDLMKMLSPDSNALPDMDVNKLKDCKIYEESDQEKTIVAVDLEAKQKAIEKIKTEMQNNRQLQLFLSTLPKDQQAQVVQNMLKVIIQNL